jgi:hypothetical protein
LSRSSAGGSSFNYHRCQALSLAYQRLLKKQEQSGKLHDLRNTIGSYAWLQERKYETYRLGWDTAIFSQHLSMPITGLTKIV